MTKESERELLIALVRMADQYLDNRPDCDLDSRAMGAGELTLLRLSERGLVALDQGCRISGNWTDQGRRLLAEIYGVPSINFRK